MIAVTIFSVFYSFFLKLNLFPVFFFMKKISVSVKMFLVNSTIIGYEINSAWFIDEIQPKQDEKN